MALPKKTLTCIDIGTDSIKLIAGYVSPEGLVYVQKVVHKVFASGAYAKYGTSCQTEGLSDLLSQEKISSPVHLCLSNSKNSIYQTLLPDMPESELEDAVKTELIQKKIFDLSKCRYGYSASRVSFEKDSYQYKIMVFYYSPEEIQPFLQIFEEHKLDVRCIENPNMALIKGMKAMGCFSSEKAYLILSVGASVSSFMVVHNGRFIFERKLSLCGENFTRSLAEICKLDPGVSEKLKKENGIALTQLSDQLVEVHHALISSVEKLSSDILYSMKFFFFQVARARVTTFERIYLTGGGAGMPGLKEFLRDRLGMECVVLDLNERIILPEGFSIQSNKNPWTILGSAASLFYGQEEQSNDVFRSVFFKKKTQGFIFSISSLLKAGTVLLLLLSALFILWFYFLRG